MSPLPCRPKKKRKKIIIDRRVFMSVVKVDRTLVKVGQVYIRIYVSLSLARFILRSLCTCFVSSHYFSSSPFLFLLADHDIHLALFLLRRSRFSLARQGILVVFFSGEVCGEHVAPSWGACINIRLIMLVARRLRTPVDHRCVPPDTSSLRVQP